METNETYTPKPDYGQKTITSQASSPKAETLAQFELLKDMLCGELTNENNALRTENEELKKENILLKETTVEQANEIMKGKKKLAHAQEIIKTLSKCKETGDPRPMFDYVYDLSDHEAAADVKDIETFWENNFKLAQITMPDGSYLIDCAAAVIPVFLVYTKSLNLEKTRWHYNGTITNFCNCWNINVAARIEDPERAAKLICKAETFTAEMHKNPWKRYGPGRWRTEANNDSKNKKILNRAANIKERIERMYA